MKKCELIDKLNSDLSNEYMHMLFYLQSAATVKGLHRAEIGELMLTHSQSEMLHVKEFSDLIIGLGGRLDYNYNSFAYLTNPNDIIKYALEIEDQVVENYAERIVDAEKLGGADGKYVELFMERQLEDSRKDADDFRQMIEENYANGK